MNQMHQEIAATTLPTFSESNMAAVGNLPFTFVQVVEHEGRFAHMCHVLMDAPDQPHPLARFAGFDFLNPAGSVPGDDHEEFAL